VTWRFTVHPSVDGELAQAAEYYKRESQGLADAFSDSVRRCINAIREHPLAGRQVRGQYLQRITDRFPYAVVYFVAGDVIRILSVAHLSRRPFYWLGRK
jgi:plasmid stabilization system protein ParE